MDLRQLRLFLAVAEEGNFTRAAILANISQPALTHRIRGLEDELGVTLFTRTPRGALLTPAGETLLEDARHLLDYAALSVGRVRRAGGIHDSTARVGFDFLEFGSVPPMPSLLTAFRERFPEAQVDLQTLSSDKLERALLEERLDIGFALGPPSRPELGFHTLLKGAYQVLLPLRHPFADLGQVTRSALLTQRLLLPRLSTHEDAALLAYLRAQGEQPKGQFCSAPLKPSQGPSARSSFVYRSRCHIPGRHTHTFPGHFRRSASGDNHRGAPERSRARRIRTRWTAQAQQRSARVYIASISLNCSKAFGLGNEEFIKRSLSVVSLERNTTPPNWGDSVWNATNALPNRSRNSIFGGKFKPKSAFNPAFIYHWTEGRQSDSRGLTSLT